MDLPAAARPHIAVVDDDHSTRQLLDDLLSDEAYAVTIWPGTNDPVQFIQQTAPDLVILDLHLGGQFRAWDVIEKLCGDQSFVQIPVIICSADGLLLRRDGPALRNHRCVIVEKPFDVNDLLTTIRQHLRTLPEQNRPRDQATG